MADRITITLRVKGPGINRRHREVYEVSPAYGELETRMLTSVAVENIGWQALREAGLPTPLRDAFLGNDAKLVRIEKLIDALQERWSEDIPGRVFDELRELALVDGKEAFERWGQQDPPND